VSRVQTKTVNQLVWQRGARPAVSMAWRHPSSLGLCRWLTAQQKRAALYGQPFLSLSALRGREVCC